MARRFPRVAGWLPGPGPESPRTERPAAPTLAARGGAIAPTDRTDTPNVAAESIARLREQAERTEAAIRELLGIANRERMKGDLKELSKLMKDADKNIQAVSATTDQSGNEANLVQVRQVLSSVAVKLTRLFLIYDSEARMAEKRGEVGGEVRRGQLGQDKADLAIAQRQFNLLDTELSRCREHLAEKERETNERLSVWYQHESQRRDQAGQA